MSVNVNSFLSRFQKYNASTKAKENLTVSNEVEFAQQAQGTKLVRDDGTAFEKTAKGAWKKVENPATLLSYTLGDLPDVDTTGIESGHVIAWNGSNFIASAAPVSTLSTVGDVSPVAPTLGQALVWTGSAWAPGDVSGSSDLRWNDYAMNWAQEPTSQGAVTLNGTAGVKYLYTYTGGGTAYRFVPDTYDATKDAFYSDSSLTTLLATKGMTI